MRIFIGLALIILLSIKIRADDNDDFATALIDPTVIHYLNSIKQFHTPNYLSNGIPNAGAFQEFFKRLSENFKLACETLEKAQFFVSAVQPSEIDNRVNIIVANFDQTYRRQPSLGFMKADVIGTMSELMEYGDEIAEFRLESFIDGTKFSIWIGRHSNDFRHVEIGTKLADYLKHVNGLIGTIQKSIKKSRNQIQHAKLKKSGTKILKSDMKFESLVAQARANDLHLLSRPLADIRKAIDEVRNSQSFNEMKTNARKILDDLNQLKLLMEKQWTDMDYIFCNSELPQQLPSVNLAN